MDFTCVLVWDFVFGWVLVSRWREIVCTSFVWMKVLLDPVDGVLIFCVIETVHLMGFVMDERK